MFIKTASRNWATENLSFMNLNGPALISFSRKEYFLHKCTGNICISGSLGRASKKCFLPNVYYLAVTLKYVMLQLLFSWNHAHNGSSLSPEHHCPFVGHFQLSDYAGKSLCQEQPTNICKESLWNPLHELSKSNCALGSEVHYFHCLTFSPIAFEFLFFIYADRGYMAREVSQTRFQFIAVWRITELSNSKTL